MFTKASAFLLRYQEPTKSALNDSESGITKTGGNDREAPDDTTTMFPRAIETLTEGREAPQQDPRSASYYAIERSGDYACR
jgi:hypothetical protein